VALTPRGDARARGAGAALAPRRLACTPHARSGERCLREDSIAPAKPALEPRELMLGIRRSRGAGTPSAGATTTHPGRR
jgi:hypothetical protein